ncbi:MAG: hypothetical protein ACFFFB_11910 [Candidatus Heimdallarchaeota archaeon]
MKKGEETTDNIKYLLGDMGMEIFYAIESGAKDIETIKIFSGISIECIRGRLPVLIDLELVMKNEKGLFVTNKGINFKKKIGLSH